MRKLSGLSGLSLGAQLKALAIGGIGGGLAGAVASNVGPGAYRRVVAVGVGGLAGYLLTEEVAGAVGGAAIAWGISLTGLV